jgi:AAA domain
VTLNTSAFRLGTMIARGWIGQHTVEGALLDACLSNHLAQDDGRHAVVATIRSGLEAGLKQPHADLPNREWQPANGAKEPYPVAETKTESDGEISLPAGVICDGAKEPAPRPKLIDGLLSTTGLVFLGGQGSAGKTFIAVGMAVALATGEPFFSRAVNEKVGTLIIAAEGREDMQARIAAAKKFIGCEQDLPILWMAVPDFGESLLKDLDRVNTWMKAKHDVRLGMILIDTVSASFSLKEEDDNAEAARICKVLRRLGDHINGVMVLVHHYARTLIEDCAAHPPGRSTPTWQSPSMPK